MKTIHKYGLIITNERLDSMTNKIEDYHTSHPNELNPFKTGEEVLRYFGKEKGVYFITRMDGELTKLNSYYDSHTIMDENNNNITLNDIPYFYFIELSRKPSRTEVAYTSIEEMEGEMRTLLNPFKKYLPDDFSILNNLVYIDGFGICEYGGRNSFLTND